MTTKEVLVSARGFIARGWTQGAFACDEWGKNVELLRSSARSWCAAGAIWRVVGYEAIGAHEDACSILDDLVSSEFDDISEFNDAEETTQAAVLAVFDEAIARFE